MQSAAPKAPLPAAELSSVDMGEVCTPPAKKRKLSNETTEDVKPNVKDNSRKKQNVRSSAVASGLEAPAVILLAVTKGKGHVIAVTGEDKCIRVFENAVEDGTNRLLQISQR